MTERIARRRPQIGEDGQDVIAGVKRLRQARNLSCLSEISDCDASVVSAVYRGCHRAADPFR
ncbi:MAG: hypothetical protein ACRDOH_30635 [Streptosporangiaceae bacterium]